MHQTAVERILLAGLILGAVGLRMIAPDQPIVENYVGRQVPTAMVARNLERGSGFLRPQLDTGPFPNLFLVEPPVYALAVVGVRRATGLGLEPAGRLVSALGIGLAAWGLFGLVRRREGPRTAFGAVAALGVFPLTIRYGRSFQPDALMLGTLLAALRCWDDHESEGSRIRLAVGWVLLALGLALKIVAAYVLVPVWVLQRAPRRRAKAVLAALALLPALLWYAHAARTLGHAAGSRAASDNAAIWLHALIPTALLRGATYRTAARFVLVRAFTPPGVLLACWGWACGRRSPDHLWRAWGMALLVALAMLAAKLHHEYYWLAAAPLVAVGLGRGLDALAQRGRCGRLGAAVAAIAILVVAGIQARTTWRTPPEWRGLPEAAVAIRERVQRDAALIAPEALLFAADRRGCRLETDPASVRRALGEWPGGIDSADPLALVAFYQRQGARYFADLRGGWESRRRAALHAALRARAAVVAEGPGFLLLDLDTMRVARRPGDDHPSPPVIHRPARISDAVP